MSEYSKKVDVAVIGAGPTGVLCSKVLAEAGLSVALICERDKGPNRHNYRDYSPNIQYDHYNGFGGGTHLWANVCRPHDLSDYANFSDATLYPSNQAYLQAEKFLNVENGAIFWHSATKPEFHVNWLKQFGNKVELLAFVYPRNIYKITQSTLRKSIGPKVFLLDGFFAQSIKKCSDTFCVNLLNENTGELSQIQARRIMICAGTVGSASLIERSFIFNRLPIHKLSRNQVGRNIHEHFMFTIGRLNFNNKVTKPKPKAIGNQIAKFAFRFIDYKEINHSMYALPALSGSSIDKSDQLRQVLINIQNQIKRSPWALLKLLLYPNLIYQIIDEKFLKSGNVKYYDLWTVLQTNPSEDRKIEFTDAGNPAFVHLQFDQNDAQHVAELQQKLTSYVKDGAFEPVAIDEIIQNASLSAHLAGSLKQAIRPEDGVVDKNFELHGCSGIFVGDASSIPVSGTSNITLTACANAWTATKNLISGLH